MSQSVEQIPIGAGSSGAFAVWKFSVDTFADLASLSGVIEGDIARVRFSQGTVWLPGTIGGTYYPSGFYEFRSGVWEIDETIEAIAEELDNILGIVPAVASQVETDAGSIDDKYISPLKLKNRRGIESFFLEGRGEVGNGNSWADSGFINLIPHRLFEPGGTERSVYMFYALNRVKFDVVDPQIAFLISSTDAPVLGEAIRWSLAVKARAVGEDLSGTDVQIDVTQVLTTLSANARQEELIFTMDKALFNVGDIMHFNLRRLGGDAADTYGSDIGVGQSGIIVETVDKNP